MDIDIYENVEGELFDEELTAEEIHRIEVMIEKDLKNIEGENAIFEAERAEKLKLRMQTWTKLKDAGTLENLLRAMTDLVWETFQQFYAVSSRRTFSAKIGVPPSVIGRMYTRYFQDFQEAKVDLVDLLVTMNFFKENLSFDSLGANWQMSRTACFDLVMRTQSKLFQILDEIAWKRNEAWHPEEVVPPQGHPFEGVTFSIDGIECGIAKPADPDQENVWYSDKAGQHTVKYELCTHISSGRIMWAAGGIPGSVNDIRLANTSGVLDIIPAGERGLADKGYAYAPRNKLLAMLKKDKGPLTYDETVFNRTISALRIEVERVNGRLKNFSSLWRSRNRDRNVHTMMFSILCNIVNIQMELQPLRKEIHPVLLEANIVVPPRAQVPNN